MEPDSELAARVARLEAVEAIKQLAARYGFGLDARDIDAVVALFVDNGRPVFLNDGSSGPAGGAELRDHYMRSQRRYTNSQHFMCNHVIDILDATPRTLASYTIARTCAAGPSQCLKTAKQ